MVGAGPAFERQQRRPRGVEHRIVRAVDDALEPLIQCFVASSANRSALPQGIAGVLKHRALNLRHVLRTMKNQPMVANVARQLILGEPALPANTSVCTSASKSLQSPLADLADDALFPARSAHVEKDREVPVALVMGLAARPRAEQHDALDLPGNAASTRSR